MAGYRANITDNKLTIEIDLDSDLGITPSGKSIGIATSHGNQQIGDDGVILGLNCYRKNPDYVKPPKVVEPAPTA